MLSVSRKSSISSIGHQYAPKQDDRKSVLYYSILEWLQKIFSSVKNNYDININVKYKVDFKYKFHDKLKKLIDEATFEELEPEDVAITLVNKIIYKLHQNTGYKEGYFDSLVLSSQDANGYLLSQGVDANLSKICDKILDKEIDKLKVSDDELFEKLDRKLVKELDDFLSSSIEYVAKDEKRSRDIQSSDALNALMRTSQTVLSRSEPYTLLYPSRCSSRRGSIVGSEILEPAVESEGYFVTAGREFVML